MSPGRPAVWVNCAVSVDGRLAYAGGRRARLSSPEDLLRVHRMRASAGAIVVGVGTVLADDPSLKVRWDLLGETPRPGPIRVVLDSTGRIPEAAQLLDGSARTILAVSGRCRRRFPPTVEPLVLGSERVELPKLWGALAERGVASAMVEGGGTVIASVLWSGSFDRLTVYVAPVVIGGVTAPSLALGPETPDAAGAIPLELTGVERLGPGVVLTYRSPRPGR
ncbi:MAG TPA: dihydrofolate reductase family protein [Thermoplasmata archaeon]|nr:dihydrofolate reductase family protein [Thermoplasmata archaeon]